MKKIVLCAVFAVFGLCGFAQPSPKGKPSAYEQVNGMKKELGLDESQFNKAYNAYQKYNNAVFGNTSANGGFQGPPSGGRPGGNGGAPMGGPGQMGGHGQMGGRPGGNGGAPMGGPGQMGGRPSGAPQGGDHQFGGSFPGGGHHQSNASEPENMETLQKTMEKQEAKLEKSMKKLFKKDDAKYAQWLNIRERQLKEMTPVPPVPPVER